ncbi:IS1096 element passenger TnpR family protein, partial [Mesonia mobilis]
MIYKFRIVLDTLDDVFRDIEIEESATLEDLHNSVTQAFGFDGTEMASFYLTDEEWNQGEEIVLFDMSEGMNSVRMMNETSLDSVVDEKNTKLIYVYDFFSMWTFYVELADITEAEDGRDYPNLMFAHGQLPDSPPE